jgi:AcrR family transcriptional regulator
MSISGASPPTNRRARKRRQLADRVAAIAFGLFEEQGFQSVTMEQVALAADIAKGTLYKYFPVKEALLAHQFQQQLAQDMAPLWPALERQGSFAAQLSQLLQAWAKWHESRRPYLAPYLRHQRPSAARPVLERLCKSGQQRGDVRSDLSAAQLAAMLECLCVGALLSWLAHPDASLQHELDAMLLVALGGVAARASGGSRQH